MHRPNSNLTSQIGAGIDLEHVLVDDWCLILFRAVATNQVPEIFHKPLLVHWVNL